MYSEWRSDSDSGTLIFFSFCFLGCRISFSKFETGRKISPGVGEAVAVAAAAAAALAATAAAGTALEVLVAAVAVVAACCA
ncbi:hypothetical protein E2C01_038343 [Portunus trituberculatus]|uniref:Uncharacterized protein n=1 Tax=Portunus trituberculatus TaxID=210409 RepID=A0A5B7FGJ3_PORTR|nr:hypothetical protein [Portunus trituberculatus]